MVCLDLTNSLMARQGSNLMVSDHLSPIKHLLICKWWPWALSFAWHSVSLSCCTPLVESLLAIPLDPIFSFGTNSANVNIELNEAKSAYPPFVSFYWSWCSLCGTRREINFCPMQWTPPVPLVPLVTDRGSEELRRRLCFISVIRIINWSLSDRLRPCRFGAIGGLSLSSVLMHGEVRMLSSQRKQKWKKGRKKKRAALICRCIPSPS